MLKSAPLCALRAATASAHTALHSAAPFGRIAKGKATWDDYDTALAVLWMFHCGVKPSLGHAELIVPKVSFSPSASLHALAEDLRSRGASPPPPPVFPTLTGASSVGCLYVALGSALGRAVLCRDLDPLFGDAIAGRRFFAAANNDRIAFQALVKEICVLGADAAHLRSMISGASTTFAYFSECLGAKTTRSAA